MKLLSEALEYKYFQVLDIEDEDCPTLSRSFAVVSRKGPLLGRIVWYPRWKQYILEPMPRTLWSADCLVDIRSAMGQIDRKRGILEAKEKPCRA